MGEDDMGRIAQWIVKTLRHPRDAAAVDATREEVKAMCRRYPVPGDFVISFSSGSALANVARMFCGTKMRDWLTEVTRS